MNLRNAHARAKTPEPVDSPHCGTRNGYSRHQRHREPACTPCLDAAARYRASLRRPPGRQRQLYDLTQAIAVLASALLPGYQPDRKETP